MRTLAALGWLIAATAFAAPADAGSEPEEVEVPQGNASDGYTPPDEKAVEALVITGYVDVGFVKASGDGTSFDPRDARLPADYYADTFATPVNSLGDVASTRSGGRFTNGFLPRSVGSGGQASMLLNVASVDLRFTPRQVPLMVFVRAQLMPRFSSDGDATRLVLQQAFGRISPFDAHELAIFAGKFDSVFGIEYLENESNLRMGITPSLTARYTTGQSLGGKAFYRVHLPRLWSAISLNVAGTNSGTRVEALVGPDLSFSGAPVGSARLGYELNLQRFQMKLGVSGLFGPRNDTPPGSAKQWGFGVDLRAHLYGFSVAAELVRMHDDPSDAGKTTGTGAGELASRFDVLGGWARLGWTAPWQTRQLSGATLYGRYDRRHGHFEGAPTLVTDRFTVGVKVDLFELLTLKVEGLFNRELSGALPVANDVFTASAVFSW